MHLGVSVLTARSPLAPSPYRALIMALTVGRLSVIRTAAEDVPLLRELAGYAEHAQAVRFRLAPGAW